MRYGKLTLIEKLPDRWRGYVVALWKCDCGKEKKLPIARVKSSQAKSCGCLVTKHGYTARNRKRSAEYTAWQAMLCRCRATKGGDYKIYVERGIVVCDRWKIFENFLTDMGPRPSPKHSIDRADNTKGYFPGNVRWATATEQLRNTRRSRIWHIKGLVFESVRHAASHFGVDQKTIRYWVKTKGSCHAEPRY